MRGQRIGSAISAVFGLIYVVANSALLAPLWTLAVRALAVLAFVAVLVAVFHSPRPPAGEDGAPERVFGRGYWWVVVVEVVALLGGLRVLSGPLGVPEAAVAWVSLVVGVHFFALAAVFGERFFHWLGGVITACGVVGLVIAISGTGEVWVELVAGVLPGAVLLGFGWWGARRRPALPQTSSPRLRLR